jgi:peptidoglycan/LPS O-acetylase OafA/YrhL
LRVLVPCGIIGHAQPHLIAGETRPDDYCVYREGRPIGRIRHAHERAGHNDGWDWTINPPLPIPTWAKGSAKSLPAAKAAFPRGLGALLRNANAARHRALASSPRCSYGAPQVKLPGLQISRAVAALSIVYFHSWTVLDRFPKGSAHPIPWLADYGWLGVDLFFAISGYVICLVISKPDFSPISFFIRRVFRLYPLWLTTLTLFAALALAWRGLLPKETAGFFFYSATLLPTDGFPFYDIGWSLQHEMLFYFLCCIIVPWFGIWGLVLFLTASTVAFYTLNLPWYLAQPAQYHAEFLAGILAFRAVPRMRVIGSIPLFVAGGTLLVYFVYFWGGRYFVPISLFLLISAFAIARPADNIATRAAVSLGDASYSIYLIHPLVFLIMKAATLLVLRAPIWIEEPIRFASFLPVIALSLWIWRHFETPFISLGNRLAARVLQPSMLADPVTATDRGAA